MHLKPSGRVTPRSLTPLVVRGGTYAQPPPRQSVRLDPSVEADLFFGLTPVSVQPAWLSARLLYEGEEICHVGERLISLRPGFVLIVADDGYSTRPLLESRGLSIQFRVARCPCANPNLIGRATSLPQVAALPAHLRLLEGRAAQLADLLRASEDEEGMAALVHDFARQLEHMANEGRDSIARIEAATPRVRAELFRKVSLARCAVDDEPHRPWTVAQLARISCLSHFHLHRVFSAAFGHTPGQYLRMRRLATAHELLLATELGIREIGARAGFENFSAFIRSFRRDYGVAPGSFRRLLRDRNGALCTRVGGGRSLASAWDGG